MRAHILLDFKHVEEKPLKPRIYRILAIGLINSIILENDCKILFIT